MPCTDAEAAIVAGLLEITSRRPKRRVLAPACHAPWRGIRATTTRIRIRLVREDVYHDAADKLQASPDRLSDIETVVK